VIGQLPLALVEPDPRRFFRRGDAGGSAAAAIALVESGRDAAQIAIVALLVASLPGRTSAELAVETERIGLDRYGFEPGPWRYMLARRLPNAEDKGRGPILGCEKRFHQECYWRRVDPDQAPCRESGRCAIRWWPATL
jgi:hypothetical protein